MGFDWIHEETTAMQDKKLTIKVRQRKPEFDVEHPGMGLEDLGPGEVISPARRTVDENTVLEYKTGCLTDFYTMGKELGRGHFGVVRMCERKGTGVQVACKSIDKAHLKKREEIKELQAEIGVMQHLGGHPNVVQLYDVFEDDGAVHLVMELCRDGDLFDFIARKRRLPEPEAAKILRQVVLAVQYCHENNVIHRDLKPENILFSKVPQEEQGEFAVKLADFGLALITKPGEDSSGLAGSPFYMAPELVKRKRYNKEIDVWSLGVILYTAVSGFLPFWGKTHEQTFAAVCRGEADFVKKPWQVISPECKSLVRKMLNMDPKRRATIDDILNHPWVLQNCPRQTVRSKPKPLVHNPLFTFYSEATLPPAPLSPRNSDPSRQPIQQALSAPKGRFSPPRTPSPMSSPRAFKGNKPSLSQFLPTPPGTPRGGQSNITPFAAALTKPWMTFMKKEREVLEPRSSKQASPMEQQTTPRPFFLSELMGHRLDAQKNNLFSGRGGLQGPTSEEVVFDVGAISTVSPRVSNAGGPSPRSTLDRINFSIGGLKEIQTPPEPMKPSFSNSRQKNYLRDRNNGTGEE